MTEAQQHAVTLHRPWTMLPSGVATRVVGALVLTVKKAPRADGTEYWLLKCRGGQDWPCGTTLEDLHREGPNMLNSIAKRVSATRGIPATYSQKEAMECCDMMADGLFGWLKNVVATDYGW